MTDSSNSDALLSAMKRLHYAEIDLTLDRVWHLLNKLDNPQGDLPPVIHVAGTNGKGSVLAMIRAGLEGDGHRVSAYTSPHLARFHERIRLAEELISERHLAEILEECIRVNDGDNITFFEITTIAGILALSRAPADYCLLEVGLGGRLDATNVVARPDLTVITPVSIDHSEFLGSTLSEIAGEKAGILKRGVPCVVGQQEDEALEVIEDTAARLGVPLLAYGQHWHVTQERDRLIYQDETGLLDLPLPILPGAHQVQNAGIALAALRHLGASETGYETAMTRVDWPARMQRLRTGPLAKLAPHAELWLDGGHNPAAGEALGAHLASLPKRPTHLICGMLNTKDVTGYLRPLAAVAESLYAVSIPGDVPTLPAQATADAARKVGLNATEAESVPAALADITRISPEARILICGSLHLAGSVLCDFN